MKTQRVFNRLVSNDFANASPEDVKTVALAVWHESFVPTVEHLRKEALKRAGYLVDKLMRFNCVPTAVKQQLCNLRDQLLQFAEAVASKCEKLAKQWGLASDLKREVSSLLEFQTRHYQHA